MTQRGSPPRAQARATLRGPRRRHTIRPGVLAPPDLPSMSHLTSSSVLLLLNPAVLQPQEWGHAHEHPWWASRSSRYRAERESRRAGRLGNADDGQGGSLLNVGFTAASLTNGHAVGVLKPVSFVSGSQTQARRPELWPTPLGSPSHPCSVPVPQPLCCPGAPGSECGAVSRHLAFTHGTRE